jgi:hypothetical protein
MAGAVRRGIRPAPGLAPPQGFPSRAHVNSNRKKSARELRQRGAGYRCCIPALAGLARPQSIVSGSSTFARNAAHGNPVSRTTALPRRISEKSKRYSHRAGTSRSTPGPLGNGEAGGSRRPGAMKSSAQLRRHSFPLALFGDAPVIPQVAADGPGSMQFESRRDGR